MGILEELAGTQPVDLNSYIEEQPLAPLVPPLSSVRNRAAATALLSEDPEKVLDNYRMMMLEAEGGGDSLRQYTMQREMDNSKRMNMNAIISILADPEIDEATKFNAAQALSENPLLQETNYILAGKAMAAGEEFVTQEAEDVRIIGAANQLASTFAYQEYKQGLYNQREVLNDELTAGKVVDFFANLVPFAPNMNAENLLRKMSEEIGKDPGTFKSFVLPGSLAKDLHDTIANMPPSERIKVIEPLLEIIDQHSGIVFGSDNQFNQWLTAKTILQEGGYTDFDKYIDNVSGVLDVIGLGFIRGARQGVRALTSARNAERTAVTHMHNPTSPMEIVSQVNAEKARNMHELIVTTEEGGEALAGVSKNQAIANNIMPQQASLDGSVAAKVPDVERNLRKAIQPSDELVDAVYDNGAIYLTAGEKAAARAHIVNDFENAKDIHIIDSMTQVGVDGNTVQMRAVYGTTEGGFLRAEDAMNQAKLALREYGIKDSDLEVLRRVDGEYVPVDLKSVNSNVPFRESGKEVLLKTREGKEVAFELAQDKKSIFIKAQEGESYGVVEAKVSEKQIQIINADFTSNLKNKGLASSAYQYLISKALRDGKVLVSDSSVSSDALRVYESLERKGYQIEKAETKVIREASEKFPTTQFGREDDLNRPIFRVLSEPSSLSVDGDFLVRVNYDHKMNPSEMGSMESFSVVRNWLDAVPILQTKTQGSLQRHIMDAASMLDKRITGGAAVAVDRAVRIDKLLLQEHERFAKAFKGMPKDRQAKLYEHIKEANFKQLELSDGDLIGKGFNQSEIDTLKTWRKAWDNHYWLENADLVRTMNIQGYQLFDGASARLFAKPIGKNQNIRRVYDPSQDAIIDINKLEMDELYEAGGTLAKIRRPTQFGDETVEYMLTRNNSDEYLRKLRDTDQVLNYRKGYYQIQYKAPRFVTEKIYDGAGTVIGNRAIAVAKDTADADHFVARQMQTTGRPADDYVVRGDVREFRLDEDAYWDLTSAEGRIAQRHRGKLLEDSSGPITVSDHSLILDPIESAVRAARSVSGRVATRDFLETSKQRFLQQYKDVLPSDGMGGVRMPKNIHEIGIPGKPTEKLAKDARTTFEYLNYLENGYINSVDEGFKQISNWIADMLGKHHLSGAERAMRAVGESNPTSFARSFAFHAYLGTNPLRQLIIQPHQAIRMFAYNPKYMASGFSADANTYATYKMGLIKSPTKKQKDVIDYIEQSGMLDAVDRHNLVRGALTDMAESSNKAAKVAGKAVGVPRRVGFDLGEQINLLGHMLNVRDRAIKQGRNVLDKAVRDELYGEARALSYGMNFAEDMPYNANSLGMLMQFMQVPHKAVLQYTNRRISGADRVKLGIFDFALWGTPVYFLSEILGEDVLPEDEKLREIVLWNLESAIVNNALSTITGQDVSLDISALSPLDMQGWYDIGKTIMTEGAMQAIMNSPSGKLFFDPSQSRVRAAFSSLSRFMGFKEDYEESPETYLSVLNEFAKISSGWSNALKAKAIMETKKKLDSYGGLVDKNVSSFEAIGQLFGFPTQDAMAIYMASNAMRQGTKEHKESVLEVYKDIKKVYASRFNDSIDSIEGSRRVVNEAFRLFKDDPVAMQIIQSELRRDMSDKDDWLVEMALRYANIPDPRKFKDNVNMMPIREDQKKNILDAHEFIQKYKEE